MSDKRNLRDHKRRLLANELRRTLRAFVKIPIFRLICGKNLVRCCPSCQARKSPFARIRNRCIDTGRPRGVDEFFRISHISRFSWIRISRLFDGYKEIVLVESTKPIEQR
ncbi:hypothetical protein LUZ63_018686 [Rhynchospora breviuscula]|uniref:Uncharacterized protein n=1 Tax=Rhynchospora breviuscula TaxID=2022672 RepID=A0A9P9Z1Q0_9POAL|nr:hypothetical protein LUZ63_024069 [Rhynchospora breviuscula]KAJ1682387.1 hypothetical protein LUZ63_022391 [Rhynchospora breviuscula]KAJ1687296.1 hypothetical protein LUZ63_018686 [Rhynchospora breviuscula]